MSPTAVGAVQHRLVVGRSLRSLRVQAGRSLEEVAAAAGAGKGTWSRVENGAAPIASAVVRQVCEFLGVEDGALVDKLREHATHTKSKDGWLSSYDEVVSDNFKHFIGLEATSNAIYSYAPEIIPGLLQKPAYMLGVMETDPRFEAQASPEEHPPVTAASLKQRQEIRQRRQEFTLQGPSPKQLSVVIGPTGIGRPYGGTAALVEQLEHLLDIGEQDNVEIRVMPTEVVVRGSSYRQFILLDYPPVVAEHQTLPSIVYADADLGFHLYEKPYDVETYRLAWNALVAGALDLDESRKFIRAQLAKLR